MRTNCIFCKTKLKAEITTDNSYFADFEDRWIHESTKREVEIDSTYNSKKEVITDVWCPECGLKYKFINK